MNGKMELFSLFDVKSEAFMRPFVCPTRGYAIRTVSDMMKEPDNIVAKHPADFALYAVGVMDESTGEISAAKVCLGTCIEFLGEAEGIVRAS